MTSCDECGLVTKKLKKAFSADEEGVTAKLCVGCYEDLVEQ